MVDFKTMLANQRAKQVETQAAPQTPAVEVKTSPTPTKPKLSFQLGVKAPAVVPDEVKQESAEVAEVTESKPSPENPSANPLAAYSNDAHLKVTPSEPQVEPIKDFRAQMDELDSLFVEGVGYSSLTVDTARTRIVAAMKELKANPELAQILKPSDVKNIMAFVNKSADDARATLGEKREKKEKKTATTARRRSIDLSGLGASIAQGMQALDKPASTPLDLNSLASMDFSKIKPTNR